MNIGEQMAMEMEHEASNTRKLLERVPEDQFDWTPHTKSMTVRQLTSHLAESLAWVKPTFESDEFVMNMEEYQPFQAADKTELLQTFDNNLAEALEILKSASDEAMTRTWRMKIGDRTLFQMPRMVSVRNMIMNHSIHHRGQLDVYLRLIDVPLPQIYGPTADEPDF